MQYYQNFLTVLVCGLLAGQLNASPFSGKVEGDKCNPYIHIQECGENLVCRPFSCGPPGVLGYCQPVKNLNAKHKNLVNC
uniref:Uncharacterized protein n=1 Tax=Ditylenchus dipsaci TaxID=166011 RepID=A0A915CMM6_9BILA